MLNLDRFWERMVKLFWLDPKLPRVGSLLRFTFALVRKFADRVERGQQLLICGEAMVRYLDITRDGGPILKPAECQQLMDAVLRFLDVRADAGISFVPKMHLMLHLAAQSRRLGNPLIDATWKDESLNRELAKACGAAHPSVFESRVLGTLNHALGTTF